MHTRCCVGAAVIAVLGGPQGRFSGDPFDARLISSDIVLFWQAVDDSSDEDLASNLQTEYLDAGTDGLRDFIRGRILGAKPLAAMVRKRRADYERVRDAKAEVLAREKAIRAPMFALEHLYPDAVYPDVYFVVGRFNSGGTISPRGLLIGVEMQTDFDNLQHIVAHELIHFQQPSIPAARTTLLAQSIREGSADFLGELISGAHINHDTYGYGYAHEAELWAEFRQRMNGRDTQGWLYGGQPADRPPDLGYFIGYRIAQSYYQRATDKRRAIADIIEVRDFTKFLADSGYAP